MPHSVFLCLSGDPRTLWGCLRPAAWTLQVTISFAPKMSRARGKLFMFHIQEGDTWSSSYSPRSFQDPIISNTPILALSGRGIETLQFSELFASSLALFLIRLNNFLGIYSYLKLSSFFFMLTCLQLVSDYQKLNLTSRLLPHSSLYSQYLKQCLTHSSHTLNIF